MVCISDHALTYQLSKAPHILFTHRFYEILKLEFMYVSSAEHKAGLSIIYTSTESFKVISVL